MTAVGRRDTAATEPQDLDEFFGKTRPRNKSGCALCGEPTALQVNFQVREIRDGQIVKAGRSRGASRNVCAKHGLALFDEWLNKLESRRDV